MKNVFRGKKTKQHGVNSRLKSIFHENNIQVVYKLCVSGSLLCIFNYIYKIVFKLTACRIDYAPHPHKKT